MAGVDTAPSGLADVSGPAGEALWRERALAALKGAPLAILESRTRDGIAIPPLLPARADVAPVLRAGAGTPWRTLARVDHPDPEVARGLALADLEGGAEGLVLTFPGAPAARGFGLGVETLAALDHALAGVQLDLISIRLDPAPAGRLNALMLVALVQGRRLDPAQMRIDFGLDPLGTLLGTGAVPTDWPQMCARLAETVTTLRAMGFSGPVLTVDLRPIHEAGATEAQMVGTALAGAVSYLAALTEQGLDGQAAAGAISFIVPVGADQFAGIALIRALRRAWAQTLAVSGLSAAPATIHAETGWRMLSRRDPHVNILRATVAAFAGAVGGADTLTVLPFTAPLGLADAPARRLARNTGLILAAETDAGGIADPAAGAGAIEALTDNIAAAGWAFFQTITRAGGLLAALQRGLVQDAVEAAGAAEAAEVAAGARPLVGTTLYPLKDGIAPTVLDLAPLRTPAPKPTAGAAPSGSAQVIAAFRAGADRAAVTPPAMAGIEARPLISRRLAGPHEGAA
jgi:methylmalonyl-CoA mutase